jgi:hypothetical protein
MSEQPSTRPRRPPPPPPGLPVRRPPPLERVSPSALDLGRPRERQPLPWPSLMKDAVPRLEGYPVAEPDQRERLAARQGAWAGMLCWGFGVIVLLLVVAPMSAIPKLLGPYSTPVSGAAFGPIIALFAMLSVVVVLAGGLWIWVAMGRAQQSDDPPRPVL